MNNKLQRILGTISWLSGMFFFFYSLVNPAWNLFFIGIILFIFGLATTSDRRVRKK